MPSPIPLTRLLPKDLYPSLDFGACSSPLAKYSNDSTLRIPTQRFHGKVATRLWSSTIDWKELQSMQPIGSGGFGSVYRSVYFGETVAVKKVKKCVKNKLASRQSFWAELNAAHLRHKNIVRIIAATTCIPENLENGDNIGTIVMEYAGERTLHQVIYGCAETLEVDRWITFSKNIAHGLQFLHSHGIVHLDIKPANVLVSREDVCKIVDFGCSLKLELGGDRSSPQMSHGGGTYTHRAPELLKGEDVSPKSDIYSLGITLWQMITREQPYTGDRQYVLYAVVAYDLRPSVTDESFKSHHGGLCRSIVSKCWSGEPSWRPSAQDVITDLDKIRSEH
ncbi:proto-oncogene serine/threonine-protein kinase mos [Salvelinus fontinalis]|uniref:non-specific serine/threonine protein kinase n=1 Tax=Salvelinus namaycush TaxID=8040 RepID=A0A8U0QZA0_SALNM|nr:proto-oncogene serine/threonine-protein kinase mos [Salvelinus namaycush]XP_055784914.1 proto-oncogene serine/threonine-protein kinase mos [Salvelinus fontinalis]